MWFIGDLHGRFYDYHKQIAALDKQGKKSIQLGDFGLGFTEKTDSGFSDELAYPNHRFIRGNHDRPSSCAKTKAFLGDFGFIKEEEIFFVSGAFSTDRAHRTEGKDWWRDEELTYSQCHEAFKMYMDVKPLIIASHDCPFDVYPLVSEAKLGNGRSKRSSTSVMFNEMLHHHQPLYWVFGHHHITTRFEFSGTIFQCLNTLQGIEIVLS